MRRLAAGSRSSRTSSESTTSCHRAVEHDLALVQHDDARADLADEIEVVLDQHDAQSGGRARGRLQDLCRSACARAWSARPSARRAAACSARAPAPSPARAPASARARDSRHARAERGRSPVACTTAQRGARQSERRRGASRATAGRTRRIARGGKASSHGQRRRTRWRSGTCGRCPAARMRTAAGARCRGRSARCRPLERSAPSAMQRISVVLPAPFGPTRLEQFAVPRVEGDAVAAPQAAEAVCATAGDLERALAAARKAGERFARRRRSSCPSATALAPAAAGTSPVISRQQALRQRPRSRTRRRRRGSASRRTAGRR